MSALPDRTAYRAPLRRLRRIAGIPPYDASLERINAFFSDNRAEAIAISVCHSLSAGALLVSPGRWRKRLVGRTLARSSNDLEGSR